MVSSGAAISSTLREHHGVIFCNPAAHPVDATRHPDIAVPTGQATGGSWLAGRVRSWQPRVGSTEDAAFAGRSGAPALGCSSRMAASMPSTAGMGDGAVALGIVPAVVGVSVRACVRECE